MVSGISFAPRLSELTTFRTGGPARALRDVQTEYELIDVVRSADSSKTPLLFLGQGSNVLVGDDGFDGVVVRDQRSLIDCEQATDGTCFATIAAGTRWDDVAMRSVEEDWSGLEALSGIPGSAGATVVQNVGAYGQEVSTVIDRVRVWDRATGQILTKKGSELGFGYRTSVLKRMPMGVTPRWIVLDVTLHLNHSELSSPIRYAELARLLDIEIGDRVESVEVREAVLELRRAKGMVLDRHDHDTWSAGSFFTNPLLSKEQAAALPPQAPRFPVVGQPGASSELVKTSAAWLIAHSGFEKGYGLPGPAALSTKHVLALTNRGEATTADVLNLARTVRDGVLERTGVTLVSEPTIIGTTL